MTWLYLDTTKAKINFCCGFDAPQQADDSVLASLLTLNSGYRQDMEILPELYLYSFCSKLLHVPRKLFLSYCLWRDCVKPVKRKPPKTKAFFSYEKMPEKQESRDTIATAEILGKFLKLAFARV